MLHYVTQAVTVLAVRFVILTAGYFVRLCRFTSLRSFLTHCVLPQHVHRLPLFGSPAGRIGLRLDLVCVAAATLWRRIRKALCSALRAVIVFAEKSKNLRQPFTSTELQNALGPAGFLLQPPCSTRSAARKPSFVPLSGWLVRQPLRYAPQLPSSRLAQGCFPCVWGQLPPFGWLLIFYIALSAPLPSQHKKSSLVFFFT